jgi:hypothetical protein
MTETPPPRDHREEGHAAAGTPRWVKAFAAVAAVLVVLVVVMLAAGHGPGRHADGMGRAAGHHTPS